MLLGGVVEDVPVPEHQADPEPSNKKPDIEPEMVVVGLVRVINTSRPCSPVTLARIHREKSFVKEVIEPCSYGAFSARGSFYQGTFFFFGARFFTNRK